MYKIRIRAELGYPALKIEKLYLIYYKHDYVSYGLAMDFTLIENISGVKNTTYHMGINISTYIAVYLKHIEESYLSNRTQDVRVFQFSHKGKTRSGQFIVTGNLEEYYLNLVKAQAYIALTKEPAWIPLGNSNE